MTDHPSKPIEYERESPDPHSHNKRWRLRVFALNDYGEQGEPYCCDACFKASGTVPKRAVNSRGVL